MKCDGITDRMQKQIMRIQCSCIKSSKICTDVINNDTQLTNFILFCKILLFLIKICYCVNIDLH